MFELVHEYPDVIHADTLAYRARAYGDRDPHGRWGGYLVFVPLSGGRVISTDRETTQSTFDALDHWAGTLSRVYLEGALVRALERQPEVQLSKRLTAIEEAEAAARAEVEAAERRAELAREEAALATEERKLAERELRNAAIASAEDAAEFHEEEAARERSTLELLRRPAPDRRARPR